MSKEKLKIDNSKAKLLLHSCCAPCLTSVYEQLSPKYEVVVFWYNPNIWPEEEHSKRLKELVRYCKEMGIELLVGDYDYQEEHQYWQKLIKGLENEPEKGERCRVCYKMRLEATAYTAQELNTHHHNSHISLFGTELSVSSHKDAEMLNKIGVELERKLNKDCHSREGGNLHNEWIPDQVEDDSGKILPPAALDAQHLRAGRQAQGHKLKYLVSNFKKAGGFKRSTELSREHNLYRQDYCGCEYNLHKSNSQI